MPAQNNSLRHAAGSPAGAATSSTPITRHVRIEREHPAQRSVQRPDGHVPPLRIRSVMSNSFPSLSMKSLGATCVGRSTTAEVRTARINVRPRASTALQRASDQLQRAAQGALVDFIDSGACGRCAVGHRRSRRTAQPSNGVHAAEAQTPVGSCRHHDTGQAAGGIEHRGADAAGAGVDPEPAPHGAGMPRKPRPLQLRPRGTRARAAGRRPPRKPALREKARAWRVPTRQAARSAGSTATGSTRCRSATAARSAPHACDPGRCAATRSVAAPSSRRWRHRVRAAGQQHRIADHRGVRPAARCQRRRSHPARPGRRRPSGAVDRWLARRNDASSGATLLRLREQALRHRGLAARRAAAACTAPRRRSTRCGRTRCGRQTPARGGSHRAASTRARCRPRSSALCCSAAARSNASSAASAPPAAQGRFSLHLQRIDAAVSRCDRADRPQDRQQPRCRCHAARPPGSRVHVGAARAARAAHALDARLAERRVGRGRTARSAP